jgi:hypothetical protein
MSLCSLTTRKLFVPHEAREKDDKENILDGEWIEIRPMSAKRLHLMTLEAKRMARESLAEDEADTDAEGFALSSVLLREAIVSWSYDAPVTPDNVDDLDIATTTWLVGEINGVPEVPLSSTPDLSESSAETVEIA